jgi:hypothetical protein
MVSNSKPSLLGLIPNRTKPYGPKLSTLVMELARLGTFEKVAAKYSLHYPGVRRAIVDAAQTMCGINLTGKTFVVAGNLETQAVGAFMHGLCLRDRFKRKKTRRGLPLPSVVIQTF